MNYSDIQHRFANKLEGKYGVIKASSCRYEGRNFYSYYTVFGQWLDIEKNVVAIFDGSTSVTSSKHMLHKGDFPKDVHVFPLDFGAGSYGWRNCNLVSYYGFSDEDFTVYHRMQMIDHYVDRLYTKFFIIRDSRVKGLENVSFEAWDYIVELCSLYKDTSVAKWLKRKSTDKDISKKRKMVRLLKDGERDVETITDALFGEGTFKKYWDYCARFRKAADKKAKVIALCERLGIASPYNSYSYGRIDTGLTAEGIRKLTAKERNDIHFAALAKRERDNEEPRRKDKYAKNKRNAFKWIVGFEPVLESPWDTSRFRNPVKVRNMYTGEVYESSSYRRGFYWAKTSIEFNYDSFRVSEDKEQWITDFYAECKEVSDNLKALAIFKSINAPLTEKGKYSFDKGYNNDDYLRENTNDEQYAVCVEFIRKQDKHYADEAARERAREIERLRREEEKRREEEYRKQVKQEQIDECMSRGIEGRRDLWRKHLTTIYFAEDVQDKNNDYYYGGNVLLRFAFNNKNVVETSKNIRIPVWVCKKMWNIVKAWHENPKCFKPMEIDTKGSGKYTISSYKNDILTAGCHDISYTEMERMYNEIVSL